MTTLYPIGYKALLVPLSELRRVHEPRMHPEYSRRLWPWLESKGGQIGIGGGWRATGTQPAKPGFAPEGQSFHQSQTFASGIVGYCAVDLVHRNPGADHRSPTWAEVEDAERFGLHAFIGEDTATAKDDEPWHAQPYEIRGWAAWVAGGRRDPGRFNLPGVQPPPAGGQFMHATIRKGDVNADVYGAQAVLKTKGGQALVVHGTFDEPTDVAVRNLQRFFGLVVDGICGPKTWAVIDGLVNR